MRKIIQIIKQAIIAIFRNKGRSFLTVLGIIIGIGSVIALISLGKGVQASILDEINGLGSTNITVSSGQQISQSGLAGANKGSNTSGSAFRGSSSNLTQTDLDSLSDTKAHPLIKWISGEVGGSSIFTVNGSEARYSILGVSLQYFDIRKDSVANGTLFSQSDYNNKNKVTVLGSSFATDLFGSANPVGQIVLINSESYKVVGVLAAQSESTINNPNNQAYIPNLSALETFSATTYSDFTVEAIDKDHVDALKTDIQNTLLSNHKIDNIKLADFSVYTSADLLSTVSTITNMLTSLLAGIAAISLVVGGIGIMNIMLVSVTERTREIGLRKAVGARTSDILWQFIVEAVILTIIGGVFGIVLGYLIGRVAEHFVNFKPLITPGSILLAVGVSGAVGLIFGIYPAARAARLNPIDALRYE